MSKIEDLLAQEGTAAEGYDMSEGLPDHVRVGRRNLGQGTVVSVRLSAEEDARLRAAAELAHLPVSTMMRIWVLDRLHVEEEYGGGATVAERLARLEREVFHRTA